LACAFVLVLGAAGTAVAQLPMPGQSGPANPFPPVPGSQQGAAPAAPQSGGFTPAPAQGAFGGGFPTPGGGFGAPPPPRQDQSVCATFPSIREDVEKGAMAIRAATERKASREEACPLFKTFASRENRMLKFLETNRTTCGVPPQVIKQIKTSHANTIRIRNSVCNPAQAAGPPSAPSLSDALGGPIIADDTTAKRGHGTFDTLTGNPLAR
jgi:hypothetical protein